MEHKEVEVIQIKLDELEKISRQIAVYFGRYYGTLSNLQDGYHVLKSGNPFFCESCGRNLRDEKHKENCAIVARYFEGFDLSRPANNGVNADQNPPRENSVA